MIIKRTTVTLENSKEMCHLHTVRKKGRVRNAYGFRDRSNTIKRFNNEDKTFSPFIQLGVFGRTRQKPLNRVQGVKWAFLKFLYWYSGIFSFRRV